MRIHVVLLCAIVGLSQASVKRGISASSAKYICGDMAKYTNIHWWYGWALDWSKEGCPTPTLERVPMHYKWYDTTTDISDKIPDTSEYLMGWNEPNVIAKANMDPEYAATKWKILQTQTGTKKLVSPAAAPCTDPTKCNMDVEEWFDQFFGNCSGECTVDYLATHYYGCNAQYMMDFLSAMYTKYNLPIWLTEFACPNNPSLVATFMEDALSALEGADYIFRYAWYTNRITNDWNYVKSSASLMEATTSTLTTLGELYNSYTP